MWSLAIAVPLLLSPADDELPNLGKEAELELAAILETTRLALVNPTASPALVRVLDDQESPLDTIAVPAFGERVLEFPRNTLAGTTLVLVVVTPSGRITSGTYSVDGILAGGFRAVWFESIGSTIDAWGELPSGPAFIQPLPANPRVALTAPVAPTFHVPVVIPANKPKGDLPPRIAPKPLPPV